METRRNFFGAVAGALAQTGTAKPGATHTGPHGFSLLGRWMLRSDELHFHNEKTAYIRALNHESPQIKFPSGVPDRGDAVRVAVGWDVCLRRGKDGHRPFHRLVLRVKILDHLNHDAEIQVRNRPDFALRDQQEIRPLFPIALNRARDWWMVRVTRETAHLLDSPAAAPRQ